MWVKWLRRLEIGDEPWAQREETSKYTDLLADGKARRHTWVMDVKSVITSPSPQAPITHGKGPLVITGLAWSGQRHHQACRCIARRRPQLAGGARLDGPSLPKALHRFYLDINWDGSELLLQSRAIDDQDRLCPADQERASRWRAARIRSITTMASRPGTSSNDGVVENVEVS
jgi:sulfane dehydrogenase subunit SoxC